MKVELDTVRRVRAMMLLAYNGDGTPSSTLEFIILMYIYSSCDRQHEERSFSQQSNLATVQAMGYPSHLMSNAQTTLAINPRYHHKLP